MYYEIHGAGEPLILLHGGGGSTEDFSEILPVLSSTRQVIAVHLQAHGRTADNDRLLSYEAMADDIAALIKYLRIEKADVMGYSLGGGVALLTAIQHSAVVRKLVVASAVFKRDGWYPEILAANGTVRSSNRRADEADPDVHHVCPRCAETRRLAGAAHQAR